MLFYCWFSSFPISFAIIFTLLLDRCLADVCRGIGYKRDFLPKSMDATKVKLWTAMKEYTNGVELCCLDPCCTGYAFTWNNGGWVSHSVWNCTDFEACGAEPHVGFGLFIIAREKEEGSLTCGTTTTSICTACLSTTTTSTTEEVTTTTETTTTTELTTTTRKKKRIHVEGEALIFTGNKKVPVNNKILVVDKKSKNDKINTKAQATRSGGSFALEGCAVVVIAISLTVLFLL